MKYDFTTILDRAGRDSLAADVVPFDVQPDPDVRKIPMWVADMSFPAAPPIIEAIEKRLEMPNFGYFSLPDSYFDSIISWRRSRNGVTKLSREHIGYENGVLGGVSSAVQALTAPGEKILVHSPDLRGLHAHDGRQRARARSQPARARRKRRLAHGLCRHGRQAQAAPHPPAILCSPHNPCGRVWELWELERAMEVYAANDCLVISDEIWSDIIMPGHKHIPTQSVSADARERTMAFYAPSKTFSLAGLIGAYHIIYNTYLRDRVVRQSEVSHYNDCNVLSLHAPLGAYSPAGEEWADEMCRVIDANHEYACNFIRDNFKGVRVMRPEGRTCSISTAPIGAASTASQYASFRSAASAPVSSGRTAKPSCARTRSA